MPILQDGPQSQSKICFVPIKALLGINGSKELIPCKCSGFRVYNLCFPSITNSSSWCFRIQWVPYWSQTQSHVDWWQLAGEYTRLSRCGNSWSRWSSFWHCFSSEAQLPSSQVSLASSWLSEKYKKCVLELGSLGKSWESTILVWWPGFKRKGLPAWLVPAAYVIVCVAIDSGRALLQRSLPSQRVNQS